MSDERPKSTLAASMRARFAPRTAQYGAESGTSLVRRMLERVTGQSSPSRSLADGMRQKFAHAGPASHDGRSVGARKKSPLLERDGLTAAQVRRELDLMLYGKAF